MIQFLKLLDGRLIRSESSDLILRNLTLYKETNESGLNKPVYITK